MKKAWWLTENGSTVQRYSSFFDDDSSMPYGLGCGGTVYVLLERGQNAHCTLDALELSLNSRIPFVIITDTHRAETVLVRCAGGEDLLRSPTLAALTDLEGLVQRAVDDRRSFYATVHADT